MALTKSWILQDPVRLGLYDAHPPFPLKSQSSALEETLQANCVVESSQLRVPSGRKQDGDGN